MAEKFPVKLDPPPAREPGASPDAAQALPRPITCIINTRSRKGRDQYEAAVAALKSAGIPLAEAHAVEDKERTVALLKREVEEGACMVIIGGGDGTLSNCAEHLAGTPVAMGVLPMGTGNTLARSLGIPLDLAGAAKTLADGYITAMDVGRVNGQVFLNSVTLGLSSEIAHALDGDIKKKLGVFSWPVIGCKVFFRHRALVLRVQSAERSYRVRTHQLVVANGRYIAGPVASSPDAAINDHTLDVFVLGGRRKRSLVRTGLSWLRGLHTKSPEAKFFQTRSVRVESLRGKVSADVDGEINDATPLELSIEPGALRVVVPRGYDARNV
jgi:YegS/Rv2252/BmrU family lipid kinase